MRNGISTPSKACLESDVFGGWREGADEIPPTLYWVLDSITTPTPPCSENATVDGQGVKVDISDKTSF